MDREFILNHFKKEISPIQLSCQSCLLEHSNVCFLDNIVAHPQILNLFQVELTSLPVKSQCLLVISPLLGTFWSMFDSSQFCNQFITSSYEPIKLYRFILSWYFWVSCHQGYPPVISYIAMENGPVEIVDFPMKNGGSFHSCLSQYQRVNPIKSYEIPFKIPLNHH